RDGARQALDFEQRMLRLAQIGNETANKVASVRDEISRVATTYGVSSRELADATVILRRGGLAINDVKLAMETLGKASLSPSFSDMGKTAAGSAALMKTWGVQVKDLEASLSALDAVSTRYAVTGEELLEAARRAGPTYKALGGDLNSFAGMLAVVKDQT